jgi:hypothetical protein
MKRLILGLMVLVAACSGESVRASDALQTGTTAQPSTVNASGEHVASITPTDEAVASSRPTKRGLGGRQTVAPNLTPAEVASLGARSRLVVAPPKALAISTPEACDFTSVASSYQDRSRCRVGSPTPGGHSVRTRVEGLDPFVRHEMADSVVFDWGDRLLGRLAQTLIVDDDVYFPTKGGTYTPCSTVEDDEPCGSNLWHLVIHGISAQRFVDGRLVEQWRRESSWVPPSIDWLSQQWEPVHQAAITGDLILIPESHGRVSAVDRATGQVRYVIASPDPSPTEKTAISSPIAVNPVDGTAWYTVMRISSTNPYDVDNSWLVQAFPDGTMRERSINLLTQRDPLCVTTFAFNAYLTPPRDAAKPWPPYNGAVGPTFPCRQVRPVLNAAPAFSLDGTRVYIVSRPYQNADHVQVTAVDAGGLFRIWTESLRDLLVDGCGELDRIGPIGDVDPTKCRYATTIGIDKVTGLMPGGYGLDLSIASPVPTPDGGVMIGTYTPYDNERGHLFRLTKDGHKLWALNFGWNFNPNWRASRTIPLPYEFRVMMTDSHYDNAPFRFAGVTGLYGLTDSWTHTQSGTQRCTRSGVVVECSPVSRLPGTGQFNRFCQNFSNWANSGLVCRSVTPGGSPFTYIQRYPLVSGAAGNVWTMSTDGFAEIHDGETGALLDRIFVDSSLVQSDSGMSIDRHGRVYVEYGGNVTVIAPN